MENLGHIQDHILNWPNILKIKKILRKRVKKENFLKILHHNNYLELSQFMYWSNQEMLQLLTI